MLWLVKRPVGVYSEGWAGESCHWVRDPVLVAGSAQQARGEKTLGKSRTFALFLLFISPSLSETDKF